MLSFSLASLALLASTLSMTSAELTIWKADSGFDLKIFHQETPGPLSTGPIIDTEWPGVRNFTCLNPNLIHVLPVIPDKYSKSNGYKPALYTGWAQSQYVRKPVKQNLPGEGEVQWYDVSPGSPPQFQGGGKVQYLLSLGVEGTSGFEGHFGVFFDPCSPSSTSTTSSIMPPVGSSGSSAVTSDTSSPSGSLSSASSTMTSGASSSSSSSSPSSSSSSIAPTSKATA